MNAKQRRQDRKRRVVIANTFATMLIEEADEFEARGMSAKAIISELRSSGSKIREALKDL